jgi:hypothetical protein
MYTLPVCEGSEPYRPPEQQWYASGGDGATDPAAPVLSFPSDVFSFGVLAFECLMRPDLHLGPLPAPSDLRDRMTAVFTAPTAATPGSGGGGHVPVNTHHVTRVKGRSPRWLCPQSTPGCEGLVQPRPPCPGPGTRAAGDGCGADEDSYDSTDSLQEGVGSPSERSSPVGTTQGGSLAGTGAIGSSAGTARRADAAVDAGANAGSRASGSHVGVSAEAPQPPSIPALSPLEEPVPPPVAATLVLDPTPSTTSGAPSAGGFGSPGATPVSPRPANMVCLRCTAAPASPGAALNLNHLPGFVAMPEGGKAGTVQCPSCVFTAWQQLAALVGDCVAQCQDARPSMLDVIDRLEVVCALLGMTAAVAQHRWVGGWVWPRVVAAQLALFDAPLSSLGKEPSRPRHG